MRLWILIRRRRGLLSLQEEFNRDLLVDEIPADQIDWKKEGGEDNEYDGETDDEESLLLKQRHRGKLILPISLMPWPHRFKCILVGLLLVNILVECFLYIHVGHPLPPTPPHVWIHLISLLLVYSFALGLHVFEFYWSLAGSDVLLVFWFSQILLWFLRARTLLLYSEGPLIRLHVILCGVSLLFSASVLVIEHFPKISAALVNDQQVTFSPEDAANLFSRLSFAWLTPLMRRGYEVPLCESDLPEIHQSDKALNVYSRFQKAWKVEISRMTLSKDHSDGLFSAPSLSRVYIKCFGGPFFFAALLKLCQDLLGFLQPLLLRELLTFLVTDHQATDANSPSPAYHGYSIAFTMFICALLQTVFLHQYFHRCFMFGMRVRAATVAAIYEKSLRLSNTARQAASIGELVNYMSTDTEYLIDVAVYLHILWSAPFQIGIIIILLYRTLGYSVFAGVIAMILMLPLNGFLASLAKDFQTQHMTNKDRRLRLLSEVLAGIRTIKVYAWERCFLQRLDKARELEMGTLRRSALAAAGTTFLWICSPLIVSILTFACYVTTNVAPLTSAKAFVALALFNSLQFPLSALPMMTSSVIEAKVALQRLKRFLLSPELDLHAVHRLKQGEYDMGVELNTFVQFDRGSFSWEQPVIASANLEKMSEPPPPTWMLQGVTWRGLQGQLIAIVGTIGSGKSSMLNALLGEMPRLDGHVWLRGRVAYVPQNPWLLNASVRDNILFGRKFEPSLYNRVITACTLIPDLLQLPAGDMTEVGERGVTLSGGQRQRVSLARACYSNADVYILDDPLSAVDAQVARHLFEQVLGSEGLLTGYTRLWVTHSLQYLSQTNLLVVLKQGLVSETGTFRELMDAQGEFAHLMRHFDYDTQASPEPSSSSQSFNWNTGTQVTTKSVGNHVLGTVHEHQQLTKNPSSLFITPQQSVTEASPLLHRVEPTKSPTPRSLNTTWTLPEERRVGQVDSRVYRTYAASIGIWHVFLLIAVYVGSQAASILANLWLSHWSSENTQQGGNVHALRYLSIYAGLGLLQALLVVVQAWLVYVVYGIRSARHLHTTMLNRVLHAPMAFFETTPLGRILNRFAKDQQVIDELLPRSFQGYFRTLSGVLGILLVLCIASPWFIVAVVPLGMFYLYVQRYYVATSRELRRLDALTRSPLYAHFSETLNGAPTIRAYCQQRRFTAEHMHRLDTHQRAYFSGIAVNRWLAIRLESIGSLMVFLAALFAVLMRRTMDPSLAGLSVVYALSVTQTLNWMVRQHAEVETHIVAVERVHEFAELEIEPTLGNEAWQPPVDWPSKGHIEYREFGLRYRGDQPPVLKEINCTLNAGEKVGVVGRTGAGKSSFAQALFRIAGPPTAMTSGTILIDGVDTTRVELEVLRTRLTLVPQETMLFSGTLRENLDPCSQYADQEIWRAIDTAHLWDLVKRLEGGLEATIAPDGGNFSAGERQLIVLARALLRRSKILVLDEATAAVDLVTDELMRSTIRRECSTCTILTIAHRLPSIFDSDWVLVMDLGSIVEQGPPSILLANPAGRFCQLSRDADEISAKVSIL